MTTPTPPTQPNTRVQVVAALSCLLFLSLTLFFIWHAGQAVWSLWHETAQVVTQTGLQDRAREAYERTKKEFLAQREAAQTTLYHLQTDVALAQAKLVKSSQEALQARETREKFEKEAKEKGLIKGPDGRWAKPPQWAIKEWWDSLWKSVDEVNQKWATYKQMADTTESAFNQVKEKTDQLVDLAVKQQSKVQQLDLALQEMGTMEGFEKRFKEEWERQDLDKVLKEAKIHDQASRVGFRVMAILHFTTGLLALVLALRSLARLLQLRGACDEPYLLPPSPKLKPWSRGPGHAH